MGRLFFAFPGGVPGVALLLLRAVLGIALLMQGACYVGETNASPAAWIMAAATLGAGSLLLVGFLTPIVGGMVAVGAIGVAVSWLPGCTQNLFDSRLALAFGTALLAAILALGPGALSIDARLFGRREIIIPRRMPLEK
ncbi:MAG TPA: hypothetical protein VGP62_04465 [Bryobacteraceae bacterium]|nr:hypothetical protein [Bryobacteraceae bacterium]